MERILTVQMTESDYDIVCKAVKQYESRRKASREHARRKLDVQNPQFRVDRSVHMIVVDQHTPSIQQPLQY